MAKKGDRVVEAFENDLDTVCAPQRLRQFQSDAGSSYIDSVLEPEEKRKRSKDGIAQWSKNLD